MLKNDAGALPLDPSRSLAMIGPMGSNQHDMPGPWWGKGLDADVVSVFEGIKAQNPNTTFTEGCTILDKDPPANTPWTNSVAGRGKRPDPRAVSNTAGRKPLCFDSHRPHRGFRMARGISSRSAGPAALRQDRSGPPVSSCDWPMTGPRLLSADH